MDSYHLNLNDFMFHSEIETTPKLGEVIAGLINSLITVVYP